MSATATLDPTETALLLPRYGFPNDRRTEPVPGLYEGQFDHKFTAFELLIMQEARGLDRPQWYEIKPVDIPRPHGAYNMVQLAGGAHPYYRSPNRTSKHLPFWYKLMSGNRWSYVVWGKPPYGDKPGIVFQANRTARANRGRGAIYTRYPIYDDQGRLVEYRIEYRKIEFSIRDHDPSRPDQLVIGANRYSDSLAVGADVQHPLHFLLKYGDDEHWQQLIMAARDGFNRHCSHDIDEDTEAWRVWFLEQSKKAKANANSSFRDSPWGGPGWLAALDAVQEAYQLTPVLWQYARLFPEVGPEDVEFTDKELAEPDRYGLQLLTMPRYTGTSGGEQQRLLEAYYKVRPHRRELLERWRQDFCDMRSNLLNYTGD